MERSEIVRAVLDAVAQFNGRKFWKRFTNFDCFGVDLASRGEAMLGAVLGNGGEEYGLSLFRGPHAATTLTALFDGGPPADDPTQKLRTHGGTARPQVA